MALLGYVKQEVPCPPRMDHHLHSRSITSTPNCCRSWSRSRSDVKKSLLRLASIRCERMMLTFSSSTRAWGRQVVVWLCFHLLSTFGGQLAGGADAAGEWRQRHGSSREGAGGKVSTVELSRNCPARRVTVRAHHLVPHPAGITAGDGARKVLVVPAAAAVAYGGRGRREGSGRGRASPPARGGAAPRSSRRRSS